MSKKIYLHQFLSKTGIFPSKGVIGDTIKSGRIAIDGRTVKAAMFQFNPRTQVVTLDGEPLKMVEKKIAIAINKPAGYLSSRLTDNDRSLGKRSVFELITDKFTPEEFQSLVCAGRLDEDSEGLLIITNDGKLASAITNNNIKKVYEVVLDDDIDPRDLLEGVYIPVDDQMYLAKAIDVRGKNRKYFITLDEGKKRQIRLMMAAIKRHVNRLTRVRIGELELDLGISQWRYLKDEEIAMFK